MEKGQLVEISQEAKEALIEQLAEMDILSEEIEATECHAEIDSKAGEIGQAVHDIMRVFGITETEFELARKDALI